MTELAGRSTPPGLVSDRVAKVRFTPVGGVPVAAGVRSNFYSIAIPAIQPGRLIAAPRGFDGPALIPGPPLPVEGTVRWMDAGARIVVPAEDRPCGNVVR